MKETIYSTHILAMSYNYSCDVETKKRRINNGVMTVTSIDVCIQLSICRLKQEAKGQQANFYAFA
jgi:hypothetical protein